MQTVSLTSPSTEFSFIDSTFTTASSAAATNIKDKADVLGDPGPVTNTTTGRYITNKLAGSASEFIFAGTSADNQTFSFRVWRWYRMKSGSTIQWIPFCACVGTGILCPKTGVASGNLTNSHFYADTISISNDRGLTPLGCRVNGPATPDEGAVSLVIDSLCCTKLEVELWVGTAASMNTIHREIASS